VSRHIQTSPITNRWGAVTPRHPRVEHFQVYGGVPGAAYSHQAQLTSHHGRLYATWTLGIREEEGPGEHMVLATSDDHGETWSPPIMVARARPGQFAATIVVSTGLRVVGDRLIAYYGEWERAVVGMTPAGWRTESQVPEILLNNHTAVCISRDGGLTWDDRHTIIAGQTGYMTPSPTASGRLILPGHLTYPYTDDLLGMTGWKRAAVPGLPADFEDTYFSVVNGVRPACVDHLYNEASFFQTDAGVLHMMLRTEDVRLLGVTTSCDNGVTWSTPVLTDYTDCIGRPHFGRLPDGRYFGMTCPGASRTPAVLALSEDGVVFDRHYIIGNEPDRGPRVPGFGKSGRYGYPYLHVAGAYGFVIYSVAKEDIGIGRFKLADLS